MRMLWFNLATDADDPILGFTTGWIGAVARRVESIDVITMRAGRLDLPGNVQVFSAGKERGYSKPRRAAEFYRHLFRTLRSDRVGFCFSHMIPWFSVLGAPILKAKRIPLVTWYAHRNLPPVLRLAHRVSDQVLSNAKTGYPYRKEKLIVLGHGIDTELFQPGNGVLESPPMLLSVGRLSPIKDLLTLLHALRRLRSARHTVTCNLLGEAPDRDIAYAQVVKNRVKELGLGQAVRFVGCVPNNHLSTWYSRSTVHVNLCPTGSLDKAALEAMACGRPSLVANEGFRPTLGPWAQRLIFRHGDPDDLARKIAALLSLPVTELKAMGEDLRRRILHQHSLDRLADKLVELARKLGRR